MPHLFGQQLNRAELQRHTGHLLQVAGVRMMELRDGSEAGVHIADVRTGSGLRFQISLDRGMDISAAEYKGMPLAWRSANGDAHPSYCDKRGAGWIHSFPGGLMTGCGLTHAGAPCVDDGEELGLHGPLSNTPAGEIHSSTEWQGERCFFRVSGTVRESSPFKENLLLHRTIETALGESAITFNDTVVNEGFRRTPLMFLYHINLGWPLLDEGAQVMLNARASRPRDPEAERGITAARSISAPIPDYKEQVFYHDLNADGEGHATVLLHNKRLNLGLFVRFRQKELPRFAEWKMMGEGMYVLGFEPANCWVEGRAKERERGTLQFLEPGEQKDFFVQTGIIEGDEQLHQFVKENNLL